MMEAHYDGTSPEKGGKKGQSGRKEEGAGAEERGNRLIGEDEEKGEEESEGWCKVS